MLNKNTDIFWLVDWALRHFKQYFSHIVHVGDMGGETEKVEVVQAVFFFLNCFQNNVSICSR